MAKHVITPAWQTSRGALVRASGCAAGVPVAGAKVFGETRQNLWVNPSGTNAGITCTSNEDGSLTISGTNATGGDVYVYSDVIDAIPYGKQVTFSASNYGVAGKWRFVLTGIGGATPDSQATFTAAKPSTGNAGKVSVIVTPGTTVNATVRVMLNEGSSAQPWCPPGLSSVSELGVACAGKNLIQLDGLTINPAGATIGDDGGSLDFPATTGINETFFREIYLPEGTYAFSVDGPPGTYARVGENADNGSPTIVFNSTGEYKKLYVRTPANDTPFTVKLMLELGSTATAYEPPHVTTAPIDLSGHELRSLPDGTRDVLSVDGSGAVSVEQAVAEVVLDGSQTIQKQVPDTDRYDYFIMPELPVMGLNANDDSTMRCDRLPVAKNRSTISSAGKYGVSHGYSDENYIYFNVPAKENTIESVKAWLAAHPVTVVYQIKNQQTVPLDPITPPSIPAADASLWAASDVPCDIEATTWTASGAEQGRQQAAMVKVAQQVRQQAETVAALAAQSLEA